MKLLKENFLFLLAILAMIVNSFAGPYTGMSMLVIIMIMMDVRLGIERSIEREANYLLYTITKLLSNQKDKTDDPS